VIKEPGFSAPWLTYGGEVIDPLQGMKSKIFDPTLKTQFMIAGFGARVPDGGASLIMMSHQSRGDFDDYNFIVLDWRYLAAWQEANSGGIGHFDSDGYGPAARNTQPAGERSAHMLLKLLNDGTKNKNGGLPHSGERPRHRPLVGLSRRGQHGENDYGANRAKANTHHRNGARRTQVCGRGLRKHRNSKI